VKNYKKYLDLKDVEKLYNAELKILAVRNLLPSGMGSFSYPYSNGSTPGISFTDFKRLFITKQKRQSPFNIYAWEFPDSKCFHQYSIQPPCLASENPSSALCIVCLRETAGNHRRRSPVRVRNSAVVPGVLFSLNLELQLPIHQL